jgi:hypothetical protein
MLSQFGHGWKSLAVLPFARVNTAPEVGFDSTRRQLAVPWRHMIIVSTWPYAAPTVYTDCSVHLDHTVYTVYDAVMPDALAKLRQDFPAWQFGTVWASAASGPDARRLWASRDGVLLSAWTAPELRLEIAREEDGRSSRS